MTSNTEMVEALMPLVKEIREGLSSNDLGVLEALRDRSIAALKTHDLEQQYAEIAKIMATVRVAEQERVMAARQEKYRDAVAVVIRNRRMKTRSPKLIFPITMPMPCVITFLRWAAARETSSISGIRHSQI